MTYVELASHVADQIIEDCKNDNFESFNEMVDCYWWESSDIKEYVGGIIDDIAQQTGTDSYIDEIDGDVIVDGDEIIKFRKFMTAVRKYLRESGY